LLFGNIKNLWGRGIFHEVESSQGEFPRRNFISKRERVVPVMILKMVIYINLKNKFFN
jgi:hypothetical protein